MGNVFGGDKTSSEESDPNSPPRSVELAIPGLTYWEWEKWFPCTGARDHVVGNPCPDMLGVGEVVPCTGTRDHVVGNPCPDMLGVGEVAPMYWGQGSRGGESLS